MNQIEFMKKIISVSNKNPELEIYHYAETEYLDDSFRWVEQSIVAVEIHDRYISDDGRVFLDEDDIEEYLYDAELPRSELSKVTKAIIIFLAPKEQP